MKGNHIIEFVLNYSGCSKNYFKKIIEISILI